MEYCVEKQRESVEEKQNKGKKSKGDEEAANVRPLEYTVSKSNINTKLNCRMHVTDKQSYFVKNGSLGTVPSI